MKAKIRGRSQSLIYLVIITSCLPITVFLFFLALSVRLISENSTKKSVNGINILLTGGKMTKSLQLARLLSREGHEVFLSETEKFSCTGHKYSRHVNKFFLLPNIMEGYAAYLKSIQRIVEKQDIDLIIPVSYTHLTLPTKA